MRGGRGGAARWGRAELGDLRGETGGGGDLGLGRGLDLRRASGLGLRQGRGLCLIGGLARRRRRGDGGGRLEADLVDYLDFHRRRLGRAGDVGEAERQRGDQRDVEGDRRPGAGELGAVEAHGWSCPTETSATRLRPARFNSPMTFMTRP